MARLDCHWISRCCDCLLVHSEIPPDESVTRGTGDYGSCLALELKRLIVGQEASPQGNGTKLRSAGWSDVDISANKQKLASSKQLFLVLGSSKFHNGFSSVQFSLSVMSDSLRPHESQHLDSKASTKILLIPLACVDF